MNIGVYPIVKNKAGEDRVRVPCSACRKVYLLLPSLAEELWPAGFEQNHNYIYICSRCEEKGITENNLYEHRGITPHKGGRYERLEIRLKPELKKKLGQVAIERNLSMADLIELALEREIKPTNHE
jgi:hypothetical protein